LEGYSLVPTVACAPRAGPQARGSGRRGSQAGAWMAAVGWIGGTPWVGGCGEWGYTLVGEAWGGVTVGGVLVAPALARLAAVNLSVRGWDTSRWLVLAVETQVWQAKQLPLFTTHVVIRFPVQHLRVMALLTRCVQHPGWLCIGCMRDPRVMASMGSCRCLRRLPSLVPAGVMCLAPRHLSLSSPRSPHTSFASGDVPAHEGWMIPHHMRKPPAPCHPPRPP
jgi:hypothetical protein